MRHGFGSAVMVADCAINWTGSINPAALPIKNRSFKFFISPYPDEVTVNMTRVVGIDPLDPDDLTRAEM